MVEVASIVEVLAALPEDEVEVVLEVVQHQTLSVLDAVCVEKKALDSIKALFIKNFILILVAEDLVSCTNLRN